MKIQDLLVCNSISQIYESKIILYGTGSWGKQTAECLKKMGKNIFAICNTQEFPDRFQGHSIHSLQYIKDNFDWEDTLIIISSLKYHKEMVFEYIKRDFKKAKACTLYAFFISLWMHANSDKIPINFRNELKTNLHASDIYQKYSIEQYAFKMLFRVAEAREDTILIYQPGKVGSQSVWNSIKDKSIQFHSIMCPYGSSLYPKVLLDYYVNKLTTKKLKIICGVREPIARDFSAFFQNSENILWPFTSMNGNIFWNYGDYLNKNKKKTDDSLKIKRDSLKWEYSLEYTMKKLQKFIIQQKLDEFSWFDYELKAIFDIDVFAYPFDKDAGYTIIKKNNIEVLLLKLEALSSLSAVIADFIGDKNYVLNSTNKNTDKIYSYTYQELRSKVPICSEYYAYYYVDSRIQHFYTPTEIEGFQNYWKEHIIYE